LIIPKEEELQGKLVKIENITETLFYSDEMRKNQEFMSDLLEKTWVISFFHEDNYINYGPITSGKVYLFLKNMYLPLLSNQKERKNFMIVDYLSDIHFQPDSLLELLHYEFSKKNSSVQFFKGKNTKDQSVDFFSKEIQDLNFFRKVDIINSSITKSKFLGLSSKFDENVNRKNSFSTKYSSVDSNKKSNEKKNFFTHKKKKNFKKVSKNQ
jgi:hypothetical protein